MICYIWFDVTFWFHINVGYRERLQDVHIIYMYCQLLHQSVVSTIHRGNFTTLFHAQQSHFVSAARCVHLTYTSCDLRVLYTLRFSSTSLRSDTYNTFWSDFVCIFMCCMSCLNKQFIFYSLLFFAHQPCLAVYYQRAGHIITQPQDLERLYCMVHAVGLLFYWCRCDECFRRIFLYLDVLWYSTLNYYWFNFSTITTSINLRKITYNRHTNKKQDKRNTPYWRHQYITNFGDIIFYRNAFGYSSPYYYIPKLIRNIILWVKNKTNYFYFCEQNLIIYANCVC